MAEQMVTGSGAGGSATGADRPGRIEARGIDAIPQDERHGRPRELFWLWLAANITYLYFVLGGVMILLGLSIWQSPAVVVVGNLYWVGVGCLAVSGPASGTPSVVVTRAQYGIRGNRVLSAGLGWVIGVAYEAVNLALGSLAAFALLDRLGWRIDVAAKVVVLLVVAAATLTISVFGHATIVRLSPVFSALLAVTVLVTGGFVLGHARFGYQPDTALHGSGLLAALSVAFVVIASSPLSWLTGADYARYLPRGVSSVRVAAWTAAGGFVPAVIFGIFGVLAGTRVDMTDPQTAMRAIVPNWFYVVFLLMIVVSSVTNNVLTTYSSGLCLQAVGVRAKRAYTVFFDGVIGGAIALFAVVHGDFLDTLNSILQFTVTFLGPSLAIYAVDILLRRNRYDGLVLHDESPSGPFWFVGGVSPAGLLATVVGTAGALLCVNTTYWEAPIARALDGVDLSALVGPLLGGLCYAVVFRLQRTSGPAPTGRLAVSHADRPTR